MSALFGGNLLLLDKLAVGGMGEVFRAKQIGAGGFEKVVAVKRILPQFANRAEFEKMFRMEMNLCAALQHSNIVQVFSNGHDGDYLYLVMEFIDGKNSAELLGAAKKKRLRIPVQYSCFIIAEAAKGLHYAHTLVDERTGEPFNIVHRDISPQNLMFSYSGDVKVCDFGIAKAAHRGNMTRPGDLKGKVPYVSPEHIDGHPLDARADIFSLGIVLYELLSQRPLFAASSSAETLKNIKEKPIPSLSDRFSDVPVELERIVFKCLERERTKRYSNAESLYRDLQVFLNQTFPKFAQPDFAQFIQNIFSQQIENEQKERKNQLSHQALTRATHSPVQGSDTVIMDAQELSLPDSPTTIRKALRLFMISLGLTFILGLVAMIVVKEWGVEPLTPSSIPGLIASYRADQVELDSNQRVIRWKERAEEKLALIAPTEKSRPDFYDAYIDGRPVIHFDGTEDYLIADSLAAELRGAQMTIAVVARPGRDEDQYLWSMHQTDRGTDVAQMGFGFGRLLRLKFLPTDTDDSYLVSDRVETNKFAIYITVVDEQQVSLYHNSKLVIRAKADRGKSAQVATFSVGQEYDRGQPSGFFMGEIAEIDVFKTALKDEHRRGLEKYLTRLYVEK